VHVSEKTTHSHAPQYAKELAEGMPGSRLRLYPGEGHFSILDRPIKEIVETLLAP
jgi:pimeloyl-ACP methyl ester carboxylesterase